MGWGEEYTLTPPTRRSVVIKYFDVFFRPYGEIPNSGTTREEVIRMQRMTPEKESTFDALQLKTPEFDTLLDTQKFADDTKMWIFVMLARCFFPVGHLDYWQVIFFVKGVAGSGKSTIAKWLRHFFPAPTWFPP